MELSERELIADAIAVHQVAEDAFCSKSVWTPYGHPSAYGGQVMAQAIYAASAYAGSTFVLHVSFLHLRPRVQLLISPSLSRYGFPLFLLFLPSPYLPSYGV